MFATVLSATTWYADVALIAVLALFLLGGIIKGLGKSLNGFFLTICIILVSVLCAGLLHETVLNSSIGSSLQSTLSSASDGWGIAFTGDVYNVDGTFKIFSDGEYTVLAEADGPIKGKIADWLAGKFISLDGQSVAEVCVYNLTSLIVFAGLIIACAIVLSIVFAFIRSFTKGMHKSEKKAVRVIDRILGGIAGLVLGATTVFVILAILVSFKDKAPSIITYINESTICKFFYDLNPIGAAFEKIFTRG